MCIVNFRTVAVSSTVLIISISEGEVVCLLEIEVVLGARQLSGMPDIVCESVTNLTDGSTVYTYLLSILVQLA